jgi:hypothetical protein
MSSSDDERGLTRGPGGKFAKGNIGGPGNPAASKVDKLRHQLLEATDPQEIAEIWSQAIAEAKAGDAVARKFVFDRLFGKASQPIIVGTAPHSGRVAEVMAVIHASGDFLNQLNEMAKAAAEMQQPPELIDPAP